MEKEGFSSIDTVLLDIQSFINKIAYLFTEMSPQETDIHPSLPSDKGYIQAVLLDVYGTLLISEAGDIGISATESNNSSPARIYSGGKEKEYPYKDIKTILHDLIRKNHTIIKQKDQTINYPEIDIISIWEQLFKFINIEEYSLSDLIQTALHFEIQTNRIWLMPHTKDFLEELKKRGIPVGIVSNAQFYTPAFMEYLLGEKLSDLGIQEDLSSWSYKIKRGKPDLKILDSPIKNIQKKYNIPAKKILYIGNDMLNDIYTAASSGLKTALFAGDKRSLRLREDNPVAADTAPDFIITELPQILPYLSKENTL